MNTRTVLVVLGVVVALFVGALALGLGRSDGGALSLPGWSAALGSLLASEQALPLRDVRPASSVSAADVACHDGLTERRTLSLPPNGVCRLGVGASSRSVRTLALRLEAGSLAEVRVDWVDRDDRLTAPTVRSLRPGGDIRLQFYEEGGGIRIACPTGCTLALATPGPT